MWSWWHYLLWSRRENDTDRKNRTTSVTKKSFSVPSKIKTEERRTSYNSAVDYKVVSVIIAIVGVGVINHDSWSPPLVFDSAYQLIEIFLVPTLLRCVAKCHALLTNYLQRQNWLMFVGTCCTCTRNTAGLTKAKKHQDKYRETHENTESLWLILQLYELFIQNKP